jgi:hypothetical protein
MRAAEISGGVRELMGFDRGVTLLAGFEFPICTPAHGTAYDIARKESGELEQRDRRPSLRLLSGSQVTPALLLQFHEPDDPGFYDLRL